MSEPYEAFRRWPIPRLKWPGWISRLARAGIVSDDPDIRRRQTFTNVAAFVAAGAAIYHLFANAFYEFWGLLPIHIYNIVIASVALVVPRLHRHGENVGAIALVTTIIIGHSFVVLAFGRNSNFHFYFVFAGSMLFLFGVQNWRMFLGFFSLAFMIAVTVFSMAEPNGFLLVHDAAFRESLAFQTLVNGIIINALLIGYALTALWRAEQALAREFDRSERLLLSILPAAIAARLKGGRERRIADRIEKATVLFADLVGFTSAARKQPPEEVVAFVDELFSRFEAACEAHGIDKIKTIGDAYMAVGGLRGEGPRAEETGRLALAMLDMMDDLPPLAGRRLQLRLGIHCGPVIAGVIGRSRISYDVWGDAVNMAARMESHSEPGRIQVSEAFRAETEHAFHFSCRGTPDLKGIGPTTTFFLVGLREDGQRRRHGGSRPQRTENPPVACTSDGG